MPRRLNENLPVSNTESADDSIRRTINAVWRIESPRIIAALARSTGDVGVAEDLAQEALVAALEQWPAHGLPANPAAWLTAVARRRGIDQSRRLSIQARKYAQIAVTADADGDESEFNAATDPDRVDDDLLRLIFIACHPVVSREARVALTLRLLGGLSTTEIARAFLTSDKTIQQRIVRSKRTLRDAHVPFELPPAEERNARLASVLEVVYLIFNEGYSATAGAEWTRPALCDNAVRLGRVLAELLPDEPEVHGLLALMEVQASRLRARTGSGGEPILLVDQDRTRWDRLLIRRGLAALERAASLQPELGLYGLQAAIAACHARAPSADDTDWRRIVTLYDALIQMAPSPVVALNRAVAVGMAFGAQAGLESVDALRGEPALARYYLLPAVRGDLLVKLGRHADASQEFERAASLTDNLRERELLRQRARQAGS